MEIKTCEQYVLARLEDAEERAHVLADAYHKAYTERDKLQEENDRLQSELDRLNDSDAIRERDEARDEIRRLERELDRAVDQMAELESQMSYMAEKYNALAKEHYNGTVKDFEPVRGSDGN